MTLTKRLRAGTVTPADLDAAADAIERANARPSPLDLIDLLHMCDEEARAIANRISGPRGHPNHCPDGVQVLEDAETIIRAAAKYFDAMRTGYRPTPPAQPADEVE